MRKPTTKELIGVGLAGSVLVLGGTAVKEGWLPGTADAGTPNGTGTATPAAATGRCPDRGEAYPNPDDYKFCTTPAPETSTAAPDATPGAIGSTACGPLDGNVIVFKPAANGPSCIGIYETTAGEQINTLEPGQGITVGCYDMNNETVRVPDGKGYYNYMDVAPGTIPFTGEGAMALTPCDQ